MNALLISVFGVLLQFSWTLRPADEQVTSYRLLFGATSGNYTQSVDVGNVATKQLDVNTTTYKFVAVVAVNNLGTSDPSTAVTVVRPQSPAGLAVAPGQ